MTVAVRREHRADLPGERLAHALVGVEAHAAHCFGVVQMGLHADVNDFTTAPSTYRRIQVTGGAESLMPRRLLEISRNDIASLDGRGFVHLYGPLDLANFAPVTEFKGVNDNTGAAVAAASWAAKMEQADLLTSVFGSLPVATASAAPSTASETRTAAGVVHQFRKRI